MWLDFAGLVVVTMLIAFIPGYLVGRGFGLTRITSLSVAAPFEFALILIFGVGLEFAHISLTPPVFVGIIAGISFLFWVVMLALRQRHARKAAKESDGCPSKLSSSKESSLEEELPQESLEKKNSAASKSRSAFVIPRGVVSATRPGSSGSEDHAAEQAQNDRLLVLDPELSPPDLYNDWALSQDDRDGLLGRGGFGSRLNSAATQRQKVSAKSHSLLDKTSVGIADTRRNFILLGLYILVGLLMATFVLLMALDTPESFGHFDDNTSHYNYIRSFLETGYYSILHVNGYIGMENYDGVFYPALWHIFTSLVSGLTNSSVLMAFNASVFVFTAVVLPVSWFALFATLFPRRLDVLVLGSLCCVAFGAFPWGFLVFGQLVSNMAAFAMVPAVVAFFILLVRSQIAKSERAVYGLGLVLFFAALAGTQPNAIFTAGLFCAFWLVSYLMYTIDVRSSTRNTFAYQVIAFILLVAVVCGVWAVFYNASFMQEVLSVNWDAYGDVPHAFFRALVLMVGRREAPQILLGIFVIIGLIGTFRVKGYRWMGALYLFGFVLYGIDAGTEGVVKNILTGFWYTDPYRIGAMLALFAAPLAALGIANSIRFVSRKIGIIADKRGKSAVVLPEDASGKHVDYSNMLRDAGKKRIRKRWSIYIASAVVILLLLAASLVHPFRYTLPNGSTYKSGLQTIQNQLIDRYSWGEDYYGLDGSQFAFLQRVKEAVPDNELILNVPNDGSAWSYGIGGPNVNWRGFKQSRAVVPQETLRLHLADINTNKDVQEAVEDGGFHYLLRLDSGADTANRLRKSGYRYKAEDWVGFESVTDETPGFEVVLSDGDMRLYKIVDEPSDFADNSETEVTADEVE